MGRKAIDLTGQRFGKWTVLRSSENDKWGARRWLCECDCGTVRSVLQKSLLGGKSTSCSCGKLVDISGERYGNWLVLNKYGYVNGDLKYTCRCSCGNVKNVYVGTLQQGKSTSCGCKQYPDLTGQKFERLKVLKLTNYIRNTSRTWSCECVCGNITIVDTDKLISGNTKSCGCLQKEKAKVSMKNLHKIYVGKNHYHYNPNKTDDERLLGRYILGGQNIKRWSNIIMEGDNYICQSCNRRGSNLNAHHLNSWNAFPEQRFDTANGITLCEDCHKEYHHFNGYGDNTLEQFRDHIACIVGEEHVSEIEETLLSRESEIIGQEVEQKETRERQTT